MGYKRWTRERLTVADLQSLIQDQAVLHFASLAAANSAIVPANRIDGMTVWLDDVHYAMTWDAAGATWRWAFGAPAAPTPIAWPAAGGWGTVSGYPGPGLYIDASGIVHGSSAVTASGQVAATSVIATLPATTAYARYRPDATVPLQIPATTTSGQARVDIMANGQVLAQGTLAAGVILFLDGLIYNPNTVA